MHIGIRHLRFRRHSTVTFSRVIAAVSSVAVYFLSAQSAFAEERSLSTWGTGSATSGLPTSGLPTSGLPTSGLPTSGLPTNSVSPSAIEEPTGSNAPVHDDAPVIDRRPPLSIFPTPEDKLMDPRMARSWGEGKSRFFAASTIDVGFVYARPRLSLGYGRPFTKWIGFDVNPVATSQGAGVYGGIRLEIPYLDIRVGPRYFVSFDRSYLNPQSSYNGLDIATNGNAQQKIITYEAEVDSQIPVGPGAILLRGSVSYLDNVPAGYYAFEETLHIVVNPPLVWRARGGYAFRLGAYGQHSVGLVADVLDIPKRDDSVTVRAGPVIRIVLSRRVEVRGSFVLTVISPDKIGLAGSDFTELGVRYRWASE